MPDQIQLNPNPFTLMNPSEDPADRLLDSLLREQHRNAADEPLLGAIETALTVPVPAAKRQRPWFQPLAAAAVLALSVGAVVYWQAREQRPLAALPDSVREAAPMEALPALANHDRQPSSPHPGLSPNPADTSLDAAPAAANPQPRPHAFPALPPLAMQKKTQPARDAGAGEILSNEPTTLEAMPAAATPSAGPGALRSDLATSGNGTGIGKGGGSGTGFGHGKAKGAGKMEASEGSTTPALTKAKRMGSENGLAENKDKNGGMIVGMLPPNTGGTGGHSRDRYGPLTDQPWKSPWNDAMSTFSIDVDTASYTNVRNLLASGRPVPPDAVRIEECINYFDYRYEGPKGTGPFAVHGTLATCPWRPDHLLARVAIKGREIEAKARPASNLVFLIDVSGSMQEPNKLPLLKRALRVLLDQLDERDRLGIVVYAGSEGVALPPTTLNERGLSQAISALEKLEAGGSTNGGAGLQRAYAMATQHIVEGGVNRVILATDGDFNVGTTGQGELVSLVRNEAAKGVSLTVLGFGSGNLNDGMLDAITKDGHGNYFYIDGDAEAKRVFLQKLTGTLVTIAKDVKIQVEFNPGKVKAYRLIGYANRILRHEDFSNDKVNAGDIGAGHTVTAFYEIVPQGMAAPDTGEVDSLRYQRPAGREAVPSDDWFTLKLRHKHPEGDVSSLIETAIKGGPQPWEQAGNDFRFASAVALFGMKLRQMPEMADLPWSRVEEIARPALAEDPAEQRAGFIEIVRKLAR